MASLKKAASCIGLPGPFSVIRDFFGYQTGAPKRLSLLTQIRLVQGKHIHLNLIRAASSLQLDPFPKRIDAALQFMRDTYAAVGVGVGRIKRYVVPQGGYEILVDEDVALDLFDSWSGPGDGIDVFLVISIVGPFIGVSPTPGSCDKDGKDSGVAIGVFESGTKLGFVFAHEVGHFLGLCHEDDLPGNLMYPKAAGGTALYGGQGGIMKIHCSMRAGCQT